MGSAPAGADLGCRYERRESWPVAPAHPQRPPILLVVGNEGAGVSPIMDAAADRRIGIGLSPGAESLNVAVAAGILLHEVTRAV